MYFGFWDKGLLKKAHLEPSFLCDKLDVVIKPLNWVESGLTRTWVLSSVGRAVVLYTTGPWFEPRSTHHLKLAQLGLFFL
ncbi:MAG: hypothetical protein UX69_C0011G0010 [candidate division WWE3 bacterium GW2011_GWA2_46_9]|uniref:Uncharacterized protein n=1 Tax=candidate division WWE3 bacterium GW2011_GWA2_46_9 TaxID=1619111 RepID=A0A0G1TTQ9_UNCKA|nr:MAG: hypothetical protein UX69_C0011G0010 [candidate division WWE3 bacterium GW2011_GWA2_46_9]